MKENFDAIIITSDEPYGEMWHTQLLYADCLSINYKVIFINPPKKWNITNCFRWSLKQKAIADNLTIVNYLNIVPGVFNFLNEYWFDQKILQALKKMRYRRLLIWHFDSFRAAISSKQLFNALEIKRIYHVIDPFIDNPLDEWLSVKADKIVITSPRNLRAYKKYESKIMHIPQALDLNMLDEKKNSELVIKPKFSQNYFVLLGTISDYIDYEFLFSILEDGELKLVIIGKVLTNMTNLQSWERLKKMNNVDYLGVLSPLNFNPILRDAKAGLIIYNEERRKNVSSPLKALNYLGCGIPVVTNIDCEMPDLNEKCIFYVDNTHELDKVLKEIIFGIKGIDKELANNYIQQNSIQNALKKILEGVYS